MTDDSPHMVRVSVLIPDDLVRKVRAYEADLRKRNPAMRVTTSDAYRVLLVNALRDCSHEQT